MACVLWPCTEFRVTEWPFATAGGGRRSPRALDRMPMRILDRSLLESWGTFRRDMRAVAENLAGSLHLSVGYRRVQTAYWTHVWSNIR